jgi:glycosyltransferase involved in cell wall biosynthesis
MKAAYRIVILSPIPVSQTDHAFSTIDLWARDLEKQAEVADVDLICPVRQSEEAVSSGTKISPLICIYAYDKLGKSQLDALISRADLIQIPGTSGWKSSTLARHLLRRARKAGKVVILGVSSDRARAALLNSSGKGLARSIKGILDYIDIRSCQSWLALRSDGVFVVGNAVAQLFTRLNKNLHVGVASWIKASDIVSTSRRGWTELRLCMASRLERMKGVHVGISAVGYFVAHRQADVRLTIIGEGPEKPNLQQQVAAAGLSGITSFLEPLSYPQPFLGLLDEMDIVVLTNLSNEQPRLVFDAMSRGCLPLCPDSLPYWGLGLDQRLLYQRGDDQDLCRAIDRLSDAETRESLRTKLLATAQTFTIDEMHNRRAAWIKTLLLKGSCRSIVLPPQ